MEDKVMMEQIRLTELICRQLTTMEPTIRALLNSNIPMSPTVKEKIVQAEELIMCIPLELESAAVSWQEKLALWWVSFAKQQVVTLLMPSKEEISKASLIFPAPKEPKTASSVLSNGTSPLASVSISAEDLYSPKFELPTPKPSESSTLTNGHLSSPPSALKKDSTAAAPVSMSSSSDVVTTNGRRSSVQFEAVPEKFDLASSGHLPAKELPKENGVAASHKEPMSAPPTTWVRSPSAVATPEPQQTQPVGDDFDWSSPPESNQMTAPNSNSNFARGRLPQRPQRNCMAMAHVEPMTVSESNVRPAEAAAAPAQADQAPVEDDFDWASPPSGTPAPYPNPFKQPNRPTFASDAMKRRNYVQGGNCKW